MQLESESKTGTDGDGLLDSLGVTTIDAAQVERSVLAKVSLLQMRGHLGISAHSLERTHAS